jgi:protein tyrosine phosphatase (PTP) superfamily phosphohydrolase (DUF442 family)
VVINLAPARREWNSMEGFYVAEQGMSYVNIPVDWEKPALQDLELFFAVMEANRGRPIYVHCFANMRASTFVYLYRTLREGIREEQAAAELHQIWDPATQPQWEQFIQAARDRFRQQ